MKWHCVTVDAATEARVLSDNLRSLVADPLTRSLMKPSATILRERDAASERFFFPPELVPVFQPIIDTYDGAPGAIRWRPCACRSSPSGPPSTAARRNRSCASRSPSFVPDGAIASFSAPVAAP